MVLPDRTEKRLCPKGGEKRRDGPPPEQAINSQESKGPYTGFMLPNCFGKDCVTRHGAAVPVYWLGTPLAFNGRPR